MTDNIKLPPFPEGLCLREDIEDYAREAVRLNMRGNAAALEPVAWKWRRRPVDKWVCVGHWDSIEAKAAEQMEADGWEVVRLYRAPIAAQAPATNADALDAAQQQR